MKELAANKKMRYTIGACIAILLLLTVIFLITGRMFGNQSVDAQYLQVRMEGTVKIGDAPAVPYVHGMHIPSNRGEVVVKGKLYLVIPDSNEIFGEIPEGVPLAIYLNHINCKITEDNTDSHVFDAELSVVGEDMCGIMCLSYLYKGGKEVTITFNNPHFYGNASAIDDFFENLCVHGAMDLEKDMLKRGNIPRSIGILLVLASFMILGTAVVSLLARIKGGINLCLIGFSVFFAGVYFIFNAHGIMFWSEIVKFNTRAVGVSMMLYVFFVSALIVLGLGERWKTPAKRLLLLSGLFDIVIFLIPLLSDIKFFDMWFYWAIFQTLVCVIMTVFLMNTFAANKNNKEDLYCAFGMLPMIAFIVDSVATAIGLWSGGVLSSVVLLFLFVISVVMLLKIIPRNINIAIRARELEAEKKVLKAELAESRIAIMISQIQPHFIYNTLGTIEQLCLDNPKSAADLVHNFSLYLRGNFSELDNAHPIWFSHEMEHVKHYTDIEQVRFPDMTIQYDLRAVEFMLPALTVQPLVENAIKHGLMGLEEGGIVTVSAYETDTHYVVAVTDDGVGFDTTAEYDKTKHIGIKNIRGRIEEMCGGTLTVESQPGKGTCATIMIPKEGKKDACNNR